MNIKQEKLNLISNQSGYVAIMSAIVISVILISLAFISSFTSYFARFNILDSENKKVSSALADACMETALVNLAKDINYSPPPIGECVSLGGTCGGADPQKVCKIDSVKTLGVQKIIKTQGIFNNSYTNLISTTTPTAYDITIDSWEEVPNF